MDETDAEDELREIFKALDRDGKGFITFSGSC